MFMFIQQYPAALYPQYAAAVKLALKWHAGQTYGDSGKPYEYHLMNVCKYVVERNIDDVTIATMDKLLATAMLHDIMEDTDCTQMEMDRAGVCFEVIEAVCYLTKQEGVNIYTYLEGVTESRLALEVKICDTATNLEHSIKAGSCKRINKYSRQLTHLNNALWLKE